MTSIGPSPGDLVQVRAALDGVSVAFGVPAYNEGPGIVHALASIEAAARACGLPFADVLVSDSSDTRATVDAAARWAEDRGFVRLTIDRSERRRSLKEANNVILEWATADLIVIAVADVVVPAESLAALLRGLLAPAEPAVAFGISYPDPSRRTLEYRASAWQMRVVQRYAASLPRDAPRADGALWGAHRAFYRAYRFPVGAGALHDDEELKLHLMRNRIPMWNAWDAVALKVPAGAVADFIRQTDRYHQVAGENLRRDSGQIKAAVIEACRDPLGALLYAYGRARLLLRRSKGRERHTETWDVTYSAKRDGAPTQRGDG
jgi:glycosyltransferase involved in cell wall biosynthesis